MYQSQKSNFYHHFYSQFAVLIKNPRENVTFEWYGIVFRRWVLANSSKSMMYLSLWKWKNITSDTRYHWNLRYGKCHQSSRKWSKNGKKTHKNSHFSTLWPQSHFGHYFFQYFSLEKPSNWFLVDRKKEKKKIKIFQKIDEIFQKKILNPRHRSKKATTTLLNGSGVLFWLNFWVPDIIWQSWKTIHKIRKFLASRDLK